MTRKLLCSFLLGAVMLTARAHAQVPVVGKKLPKVHVGIKAGANFDQITGSSWKQDYKPGVVFGGFVNASKGHFGLQVEVLFNTAQYQVNDSLSRGTFRALYFNLPVLLEYKIAPRVWLQAGPQFGNLISMKSDNSSIKDPKSFFNSSSVSGVLGAQVNLPLHLVVGARYILGFTDVRNSSVAGTTDAWKNRTIQAYLGFRFI